MSSVKRLIVVGGIAGGASAAARARRLSESCEIIVYERSPHMSLASCGLPYYVGDVITDEQKLLVATPEFFKQRLNIDVKTQHEVIAINATNKTVDVKDLKSGAVSTEAYDALVLAPGAQPIRPPVEGIDLPGIFELRTLNDAQNIRTWADKHSAKRAVVVGAGYVGLEMVENLAHRGIDVTVVELADHILQPLDAEMVVPVEDHMREKGVTLRLGDAVSGFSQTGGTDAPLRVQTRSGAAIETDLVVLSIGVRPETTLAKQAGAAIGKLGGISVDAHMRTSLDSVWAVGDAVEIPHVVLERPSLTPLAGPANRQGRTAANDIFGHADNTFRGVQGTAIVQVFDLVAAGTGCNEKTLKQAGITDYERIYLHPAHHAGYYPGATPMHIKLLFKKTDGRVLGAHIVGQEGVARRIDVIAMVIQKQGTVKDLQDAELAYAPPFGSAKDPINIAGMIAMNAIQGDCPVAAWEDLGKTDAFILDVRTAAEFATSCITNATNIPLDDLRGRIDELPKDREIWITCAAGLRAYFALRILVQHGYTVKNLTGGMCTYCSFACTDKC